MAMSYILFIFGKTTAPGMPFFIYQQTSAVEHPNISSQVHVHTCALFKQRMVYVRGIVF